MERQKINRWPVHVDHCSSVGGVRCRNASSFDADPPHTLTARPSIPFLDTGGRVLSNMSLSHSLTNIEDVKKERKTRRSDRSHFSWTRPIIQKLSVESD